MASTWLDTVQSPRSTHQDRPRAFQDIEMGDDVTVVPFGGSMSNTDAVLGSSLQENEIGPYLTQSVDISRFGRNELLPGVFPTTEGEPFTYLPQRDSTEITEHDLELLIDTISQSESRTIVVTTGLNRIVDIARYIERNLPPGFEDRQIVVTGSYDLFNNHPSDGKFNLGFAMGYRYRSESGVFVSLNAGSFRPDNIIVNPEDGKVTFLAPEMRREHSSYDSDLLIVGLGGTIEWQDMDIGALYKKGFCKRYLEKHVRPLQTPSFHDIEVESDSREITQQLEKYVDELTAVVASAKQKKIVFTVGTFGAEEVLNEMWKRSEFIEELQSQGKTVVAACSMIHPKEQKSDAPYNLGIAVSAARHLEPGLYLGVHGIMAKPGTLTKNVEKNRFELVPARDELLTAHFSSRAQESD